MKLPWNQLSIITLGAGASLCRTGTAAPRSTRMMSLASTPSHHPAAKRPFPVYPLSHRERLMERRRKDLDTVTTSIKTLHFVRHAEGYHNVNKEYRDLKNLDARLTPRGKDQCKRLAEQCLQQKSSSSLLHRTELVVTSPLTRCVETSLLSFPTLSSVTPFVAHEDIRETVNFNCDRRRRIKELKEEFPSIDFSRESQGKSDHDAIWQHYHEILGETHDTHRESAQLYKVAERGRRFLEWIAERPEKEIVVCTHSAFLRCLKSWGQEGGVPRMPPQDLDDRCDCDDMDVPLLQYCGDDPDFEDYMRSTYDNCELRSFLVVFDAESISDDAESTAE